jgi:hypothetical protein
MLLLTRISRQQLDFSRGGADHLLHNTRTHSLQCRTKQNCSTPDEQKDILDLALGHCDSLVRLLREDFFAVHARKMALGGPPFYFPHRSLTNERNKNTAWGACVCSRARVPTCVLRLIVPAVSLCAEAWP